MYSVIHMANAVCRIRACVYRARGRALACADKRERERESVDVNVAIVYAVYSSETSTTFYWSALLLCAPYHFNPL